MRALRILLAINATKNSHIGNHYMVSREGLEPSTPGLKGPCSNLLSYRPELLSVVGDRGVEPLTSSTSKTRSSQLS